MIGLQALCAGLSVVCVLASSPPYLIDTIRGKTRPERATWAIFTILGVIAVVSQLAAGATWSVLFTAVDSGMAALVLLLSFKHGVGGWAIQDRIGLAVAAIGVILAVASRDPLFGVVGVILADASGMVLTIRKVFADPASETTVAWALSGTGALVAIPAVTEFTPAQVSYLVYLAVANWAVVAAQQLGYARNKRKQQ